jgi:hypothetical protein
MKKYIAAIVSLFVLSAPLISIAHPGHGEHGGYTITHYFTEPTHVITTALVLFVAIAFVRNLRRKRQTNENN